MEADRQTAEALIPERTEAIDQVLDSLRGKIRQYVLAHGLLLAVVWIVASFWVALALDYLPVTLGFSELSQSVRAVLLIVIAAVLGLILYRQVFQPMARRLKRKSLALLLERRFPELNDALATVVHNPQMSINEELAGRSESEVATAIHRHQQMLADARTHAERTLKKTALAELFNFKPLILVSLSAVVLLSSVGWFAITQRSAFSTAMRRLYMLDDYQWPRDCRIEMVGLKIKHATPIDEIKQMGSVVRFNDNQVFVGKAAKLLLLVRAEMPETIQVESQGVRRLPGLCEFTYRTSNGKSGRLPMSKVGGARDGFQTYALDQDILEGLAEDLTFYVRGDDHRIGPFEIKTVSPPILVERSVDCVFPDYLVDEASSRFTPRQIELTSGTSLPIGTDATIQLNSNRPLQRLFVLNAKDEVLQTVEPSNDEQLRFNLSQFRVHEPIELGIVLQDKHGVFSDSPSRLRVAAEVDKPPQVKSRLTGIGIAVTPEARIPVITDLKDKHGIQRVWIELQTPLTETIALNQTVANDLVEGEIDLRQLRIGGEIPTDLPTQSDSQVVLTVLAKDHFNLEGQQNIGAGNPHPLEIVSSDKLLRMLERDEADQRFRLEQIHREMTEARGYIGRARSARQAGSAGFEPGDQVSGEDSDVNSRGNSAEDWDLRQLFLQRAVLQNQKSIQEIEGVAFTFDNIRLQLINNRIDAEDRKDRLANKVVAPLTTIATESMPRLERSLKEADALVRMLSEPNNDLNQRQRDEQKQLAEELTLASLSAVDSVLAEIQDVLEALLKFETQNELLELVRDMLQQQQALQKRTEALRNQEAFDDIFDK